MAILHGTKMGEHFYLWDGVTEGAHETYADGGDDVIYALGGNDWIPGGAGADLISGGAGFDMVDYSDSETGVVIYLTDRGGITMGGTAEGDRLFFVEGVTGSSYRDFIVGDDGNKELWGMGG